MIDYRESAAPTSFAGALQGFRADKQDLDIRQSNEDCGERLVRGHLLNCIGMSPKSKVATLYLRTCMPYVIQDGICLNREYKPLGVAGKSWSNWVDYEVLENTNGVDHPENKHVWFYHDGNAPWVGGKTYTNYLYRVMHRFYPSALEEMK